MDWIKKKNKSYDKRKLKKEKSKTMKITENKKIKRNKKKIANVNLFFQIFFPLK